MPSTMSEHMADSEALGGAVTDLSGDLPVDLSAELPVDLSADALLKVHHQLSIVADKGLTVRALLGDVRLLASPAFGVGSSLLDVAPEPVDRRSDLDALRAGRMHALEIGLVRRESSASGRFVWAQTVAVRDAGGSLTGVIHMLAKATALGARWEAIEAQRREVAELRIRIAQLTMDVALAQGELKRLDDAKSQFVSAAAHEMRNPLASLIGYLELMETEDVRNLSVTQRDSLDGISRSAQRLRLLTNNLLDITRIDFNRLELLMGKLDSLDLVEQALGEMQPLFDSKHQRIIIKADPHLPEIWCDRLRAMQILINLLSNAHKYTPEGGTITVQVGPQKGQPMLCIRVKDNGIGIPVEDQFRLFTRFFRASNAGSEDGAGAGLGLAITQALVRLHGGKMWFESKLGKGTTFFVTFPVAG